MAPQANGIIAPSSEAPRVVLAGKTGRILCVADIRGDCELSRVHGLSVDHELNRLIREHEATAVIHTGDFGFMNSESLERMGDKILRHLVQYSPLISPATRAQLLEIPESGRAKLIDGLTQSSVHFPLSQFPLLLTGAITFPVPVFTVWGLIEDVRVLEKFRTGEYEVRNLSVVDEATTRVLDVGGLHLRLFGLGGAIAPHKLFDNGEGLATIAGGQGTMWTTALQIGELIDTATRVSDPTETRLLIATAPMSRHGLLHQLAVALRADLTISGGVHFRYPASYNEASMHEEFSTYRQKLETARDNFQGVYSKVKDSLDRSLTEQQKALVQKTLTMADYVPAGIENDDGHMTNIWHWVLPDGRVSAEVTSSGINFAHRAASQPAPPNAPVQPKREEPKPQPRPVAPAAHAPAQTQSQPHQPPHQNLPHHHQHQQHPYQNNQQSQHQSQPNQQHQLGSPINQMSIRGIAKRPIPTGPLPAKPHQQAQVPQTGAGGAHQPPIASPVPTPAQNKNMGPIRAPRGPAPAAAVTAPAASTPAKDTTPITTANAPKTNDRGAVTPANANRPERGPRPARNGKSPGTDLTPAGTPAPVTSTDSGAAATTPATTTPKELKARPEPKTEKPKTNGDEEGDNKRANSLYIKGIPTPTTDDDLRGLFENASKITNIKIIVDHMTKKQKVRDLLLPLLSSSSLITNITRGGILGDTDKQDFAYVDFQSEEDANEALKNNKGAIRDTTLNISISNPTRRGDMASRGGPRGRGSFRGRGRGGFGAASGARDEKAGGGEGGSGSPAPAASAPAPAPAPAAAPAAAAAAGGEKK